MFNESYLTVGGSKNVIDAYESVGVPLRSHGATCSVNLFSAMVKCGFRAVENLQKGDVLLNPISCAALYNGSDTIVVDDYGKQKETNFPIVMRYFEDVTEPTEQKQAETEQKTAEVMPEKGDKDAEKERPKRNTTNKRRAERVQPELD